MAFGPNPPPIQAHICVKGAADAIPFYEKAFGAVCTMKHMTEDGKRVMHSNLEMFGSEVMMHDDFPEFGSDVQAPSRLGGASQTINVNRPNPAEVDEIVARAAAAGATVILEPQDVFWGCRYGKVRDPFGHVWAFNAPLKPPA
jgi:PhnB protein